jgi:hypothetical protein
LQSKLSLTCSIWIIFCQLYADVKTNLEGSGAFYFREEEAESGKLIPLLQAT